MPSPSLPSRNDPVNTLEQGDVFFFYRPRVETENPESASDVQQLYMVLHPHEKERFRLALLGRDALPAPHQGGRFWGFIDTVRKSPKAIREGLGAVDYQTKTRGQRHQPAARPAGEGVYRVVRHGDHTHLIYALELPEDPEHEEAPRALNIESEASYIFSVRNPEKPAPRSAGLPGREEAEYPEHLKQAFRGRRFAEVDPPDFLNHEGSQFLLIAADEDVKEDLGLELEPEKESASSAEIFQELHLERTNRPTRPLFEGTWR